MITISFLIHISIYAQEVKDNVSKAVQLNPVRFSKEMRGTFNQKKILLEVNIFNFSGNLYNKKLRVDFVKFIRKEKKFKGIDQLRKQIKLDLKVAKQTY